MARLDRYRRLAPFTIDELVEAANSVLRDQPRLRISKRTVRYYITEGIINPPLGAPKYARYPFESLLRIVGARCLLEQGTALERSRETLDSLIAQSEFEAERQVSQWLERPEPIALMESPPLPAIAIPKVEADPVVRRILLDRGLVLEANNEMSQKEALNLALIAIRERLQHLP